MKVQAAGPWTLAAGVELHSGHRVLTDRGAVREFAASLLVGLRTHVAEVAARTGAQVLVQLDEPTLPAVLAAALPTASGYGTVRSVGRNEAQDALRDLISGLGVPVIVHCCADRPPVRLLADIGAAGIGIDATRPAFSGDTALPAALDALGEVWDTGTPLHAGTGAGARPRTTGHNARARAPCVRPRRPARLRPLAPRGTRRSRRRRVVSPVRHRRGADVPSPSPVSWVTYFSIHPTCPPLPIRT